MRLRFAELSTANSNKKMKMKENGINEILINHFIFYIYLYE
jgi:hypothetical protein